MHGSSITAVVSRTFWVSKKSPLLAVGAISWKPKTSAKPLQLYYLVIRLVIRQSCTHTPVSCVRTPPSCRSIYRCLKLQNFEQHPKDYPIGGTPLRCICPNYGCCCGTPCKSSTSQATHAPSARQSSHFDCMA